MSGQPIESPAYPSVVDESVEAAESIVDRGEHPRHRSGVTHVRGQGERRASMGGDGGHRGLSLLPPGREVDHHGIPGRSQRLGDAAPDSSRGSGDQRDLAHGRRV
jgi:hypothetical protein